MGFVDLHSHVLFGLDDGCKELAHSLELTAVLAQLGFDTVYATPHQKIGFFSPSRAEIDQAHARVAEGLAAQGTRVQLLLGAENFWDEQLLTRSHTAAQPTYTGGKAFLFELPVRQIPPHLDDTLFKIRLRGLLPVMAHPERYAPLWDDPDRTEALHRTAAFVVDLGALDGAHGRSECKAAQRLLQDGMAHAVASDVHTLADARSAAAGIAWIKKRLGEAAVTRLLDENPRRILAGELPD